MSVELVSKKELGIALNDIRFLNIQHRDSQKVDICPIFIATRDTIDVLISEKALDDSISVGDDVLCKFEHNGFEYIINGSILDICKTPPSTLSIKVVEITKVHNRRKDIRYETNLEALLRKPNEAKEIECVVKNISKGGVAIICDKSDLEQGDNQVILEIQTDVTNLTIQAQVLRKTEIISEKGPSGKEYSYGMKFKDVTHQQNCQLDMLIGHVVAGYHENLSNTLSKVKGQEAVIHENVPSKVIFIESNDRDIMQLEHHLKELSLEISVLQEITFLMDCLEKEKPRAAIIHLAEHTGSALDIVNNAINVYRNVQFFIVTGFDTSDVQPKLNNEENVHFLYKPFIYSEIEQKIIRYI